MTSNLTAEFLIQSSVGNFQDSFVLDDKEVLKNSPEKAHEDG